uniref:PDZ domain-containing protein n=1 Tax=Hyaloperonospora arabidopsidis (strain Emoy2) TaxID=559515 RepID=M4BZ55_HYAAE
MEASAIEENALPPVALPLETDHTSRDNETAAVPMSASSHEESQADDEMEKSSDGATEVKALTDGNDKGKKEEMTSSRPGTPLMTDFSTPREENTEPTTPVGEPVEQTFVEVGDRFSTEEKSDMTQEEEETKVEEEGQMSMSVQEQEEVQDEVQLPSVVSASAAVAVGGEKSVEVSSGHQLDDEVEAAVAADEEEEKGVKGLEEVGQPTVLEGEEVKVQEEVKAMEQAGKEPQVLEEADHSIMHDQAVPDEQAETELTVQSEGKHMMRDEVGLTVQDEVVKSTTLEGVEMTVDDEVEPDVQDKVEPKEEAGVEHTGQDEAAPKVEVGVEHTRQDGVELAVEEASTPEHGVELMIPSPKRPVALNLVHHDIDDEASDSEDEAEEPACEDTEEDADLGTPLGYASAAGFGEGHDDFASHRFLGPSVASDPSSARALHSLRRVALHDKPPRFVSEAPVVVASSDSLTSSGESSGRNSSSASAVHVSDDKPGLRAQSVADSMERSFNSYTLTFTEPVLGFDTSVVMSLEKELLVEVSSVEKESPAHRGGVVVGDYLISINGQHIEPHTTNEQVLEIIQTSSVPRTLVFQRDLHDKDTVQSKSLPDKKLSPAKPLMGRLGAAMSQGALIIGSKWKRKKTLVHSDSFCDGCGMDPITGALWTCSVCSNYNLCSECYDMGTHGMENSEQMQALSEATVQYKLQKKCKHFTPEFLLSLRRDICKGRPDKFEYLGEWIADIVMGTSAVKITVRGIEIPSLPPASRQRFVSHLMPLVSNRTDIEVNIEWLPDDSDRMTVACRPSVDRMSAGAFDSDEDEGADHFFDNLEKLRIWISDKKTRTTSPFA